MTSRSPRSFEGPAHEIALASPPEFRAIAERMHPDFELDIAPGDENALIEYFAAGADRRSARIVADYLDELLASGQSRARLAKIWNTASSERTGAIWVSTPGTSMSS